MEEEKRVLKQTLHQIFQSRAAWLKLQEAQRKEMDKEQWAWKL